jgi:hypothetical protein
MEFKYALGDELKDTITGFTGIVMARTDYLTGCQHYGLIPRKLDKDGNPQDYQWIDESRLVSTGKGLKDYKAPDTSGPEQNPPSY